MKTIVLIIIVFSGVLPLHAQLYNFGNLMIHHNASVAVLGDFTNDGVYADSGQVFLLDGNSVQTISGTSQTSFNNLKVSNSSGARLNRDVSITNSLDLESGGLELNANTLSILNGQTSAINNTNGYIISELTDNSSVVTWQINSAPGTHIIPFGTVSGVSIPFQITVTSGDIGNFSISTYPTAPDNTPYPVTPVAVTHMNDSNNNDNSINTVDRFWYLEKSRAGGTATITFTATPAEIGSITGLNAQKWNESSQGWEAPLPGQTATATSVTVPDVSNFSVWVLTSSESPLPVELLDFSANQEGDVVLLNWSTASEIQSQFFYVEKTSDFVHFSNVARVEAAGTSNEILRYDATDWDPFYGISYYRLRQVDIDGNYQFSNFASVDFGSTSQMTAIVYPVPAQAGNISLKINNVSGESIRLDITDLAGRTEYSHEFAVTGSFMDINLPDTETLSPGGKLIRITTSNGISVFRKAIIESK